MFRCSSSCMARTVYTFFKKVNAMNQQIKASRNAGEREDAVTTSLTPVMQFRNFLAKCACFRDVTLDTINRAGLR